MGKKYQNVKVGSAEPAVPEQVRVALAELVGEVREGLLALVVGAGLQVLTAMREADVILACGPKGRHDPARTATRHGHEAGSVSLDGRRATQDARDRRQRRACDTDRRAVLGYRGVWPDGDGTDVGRAVHAALPGRTRAGRDAHRAGRQGHVEVRGLAPVGRGHETALAELLAADLSGLDLVALMVDGVHFGERCCVVVLGIDIEETKHPLSLGEGSTENATLVRELLVGLRERGLNIHPPHPCRDRPLS